jgi:hypothetical protein
MGTAEKHALGGHGVPPSIAAGRSVQAPGCWSPLL